LGWVDAGLKSEGGGFGGRGFGDCGFGGGFGCGCGGCGWFFCGGCGWFFVIAEAALAVGVVVFAGGVAVGFVALEARAFGAVGEGFAGFEGLAGESDFFAVGGEDDVAGYAAAFAFGDRAGFDVSQAGLIDAVEGGGLALLKAAFEQAEGGEMKVDLDGGAVLGEDVGDGDGVGAARTGGELLLVSMVVAEEFVFDGRRLAVGSGGHDVAAYVVHGGSWLSSKAVRDGSVGEKVRFLIWLELLDFARLSGGRQRSCG
jgi:hypothetical protein